LLVGHAEERRSVMEDPLTDTSHRPWPLPRGPWVMRQRWSNLVFIHRPSKLDAVRALVPPALTLDLHDGTAWVSVTPFYLSHLRARGIPRLPFVSAFPELNVRTYVTYGGKPGVYFFSLDAGNALAVFGARTLYHLPYFRAAMSVYESRDATIHYWSHRTHRGAPPAEFSAQYRPAGAVTHSKPGSIDHWLTERYCLYALDTARRVYRADIHHHPWPLQAAEVDVERDTMAAAAGLTLSPEPTRLSFSRRIDVFVWAPERVD
jgi:uncharacterized protein YqjF (DUF2071 family)